MAASFALATLIATGQGVLWEVPAASVPAGTGPGGQVLAYAAPGVAFVGGNRLFPWAFPKTVTWLSRFSMAGQPADLVIAGSPAPADGIPTSSSDYTAAAAGSGGVYFTGVAAENCLITGCQSIVAWIEFHTVAGGQVWRSNEDGATYAAAAPGIAGAFAAGRAAKSALLVKYEAAGTVVWRRSVVPGDPEQVAGFATVAAFPGGGVVAGGTIAGASGATALLQRYDEQGVPQWSGSSGVGSAIARLAVEPAGNVYAAGTFERGASRDLVLTKYGADGSVRWSRARTGVAVSPAACEAIGDLAIDGAGNAVMTGTASTALGCVAWTAKYDAAGNLLWIDEYASTTGAAARASALAVDATNHVLVAGAVDSRPFVRKLGPHGTALWTVGRPSPSAGVVGEAIDIVIGSGGEVLVLVNDASQAWLTRLDPGPAEPPSPAQLQLTLSPEPWVAGRPITLTATARGVIVPSGTIAFRANGNLVCNAVALQWMSATTARADCSLPQGLPAGSVRVEATYSGDANNGAASTVATVIVAADAGTEIPLLSPAMLALLAAFLALAGVAKARCGR
jgi:hypothetical protein